MKEATHPSTDNTLNMPDYLNDYEDKLPRWQVRRIAVSMSHSDTIETKILLEG